jgi:hypothetical protein
MMRYTSAGGHSFIPFDILMLAFERPPSRCEGGSLGEVGNRTSDNLVDQQRCHLQW